MKQKPQVNEKRVGASFENLRVVKIFVLDFQFGISEKGIVKLKKKNKSIPRELTSPIFRLFQTSEYLKLQT